jgi:hypothetical protein
MKPVNEELKNDICKLKILHAKKDKSEFKVLKDEIMHRHRISKATVYREMKKDTPGEYKIPNYSAAAYDITEREIMMVRELLLGGRQHNEIIKILSRELEIPYNWERFNKARELGESDDKFQQTPMESAFARNGHYFVQQLLGLEYMAPGSFTVIQFGGTNLKFTRESYEILQLLIMKDNPQENDHMNTAQLADEVIQDKLMRINVNRQLARMSLNPEAGSSFAMKNLLYVKEKLGRKKWLIEEKKKFLLYDSHLDAISKHYSKESEDNPSGFHPFKITNSQALRYFYQKVLNGKGRNLVGEGISDEPGSVQGMALAAGTTLKTAAREFVSKNKMKPRVIIRRLRG